MNNILLTGATGLIGKAVLEALLKENFKVYCAGRSRPQVRHPQLIYIPLDLENATAQDLACKLPLIHTIVHLAAHLGGINIAQDFFLYQKINIHFTENLFQFARHNKVKKVILASSLSILKKPLRKTIDERHPVSPASAYAVSKYWGETLLFRLSRGHFTPISMRFSSPLPESFDDLPETVVKKWIKNAVDHKPIEIFGSGQRSQDFISTKDIASAIIKAVRSKKSKGIYNIAAGQPIRMKTLAELIAANIPGTKIKFGGPDKNESDRFNISITKAKKDFQFKPEHAPQETLRLLIQSAYAHCHLKRHPLQPIRPQGRF